MPDARNLTLRPVKSAIALLTVEMLRVLLPSASYAAAGHPVAQCIIRVASTLLCHSVPHNST